MGYNREYYLKNKKKWAYNRANTQNGRATRLLCCYNYEDKKYGRGHGDLTPKWIVDNIFSKSCSHCGETDWRKIGCNRLDNSKPHTKDNVEPCCWECNTKLSADSKNKPIDQIDMITGEVIKTWKYMNEARKNGFRHCYEVANGKRNSDKGFIFRYWN